jgi:hypothetical protein
MKKIHYIIVMIVIALVAWLVIDFVQNKSKADSILADLPRPITSSDKLPPIIQPQVYPQVDDWSKLFRPKITEVVQPPVTAPQRPNYILTATIIRPDLPALSTAFILNPTINEEKGYKIGDKIYGWEVIEIISEEAKLRNAQGEILHLRIQKQWPSLQTPQQFKDIIDKMPVGSGIPNIVPPEILERLQKMMDGQAPEEQVKEYIKVVIPLLPPAQIKDHLAEWFDIPANEIPDNKLGEYCANLYDVVGGKTVSGSGENILFSTRVNPDNSAISPTSTFKPSDRRIYACFVNQGALQGLSSLVARWTNINTKQTIHISTKPITKDASFNFIWVEKKEGWAVAEYEVELFKPGTLEKVASGRFSIVP